MTPADIRKLADDMARDFDVTGYEKIIDVLRVLTDFLELVATKERKFGGDRDCDCRICQALARVEDLKP